MQPLQLTLEQKNHQVNGDPMELSFGSSIDVNI